jgi:hypothetical protein
MFSPEGQFEEGGADGEIIDPMGDVPEEQVARDMEELAKTDPELFERIVASQDEAAG